MGSDYFCGKLYQLCMGSSSGTLRANMALQYRFNNDNGHDFHGSIFLCV